MRKDVRSFAWAVFGQKSRMDSRVVLARWNVAGSRTTGLRRQRLAVQLRCWPHEPALRRAPRHRRFRRLEASSAALAADRRPAVRRDRRNRTSTYGATTSPMGLEGRSLPAHRATLRRQSRDAGAMRRGAVCRETHPTPTAGRRRSRYRQPTCTLIGSIRGRIVSRCLRAVKSIAIESHARRNSRDAAVRGAAVPSPPTVRRSRRRCSTDLAAGLRKQKRDRGSAAVVEELDAKTASAPPFMDETRSGSRRLAECSGSGKPTESRLGPSFD